MSKSRSAKQPSDCLITTPRINYTQTSSTKQASKSSSLSQLLFFFYLVVELNLQIYKFAHVSCVGFFHCRCVQKLSVRLYLCRRQPTLSAPNLPRFVVSFFLAVSNQPTHTQNETADVDRRRRLTIMRLATKKINRKKRTRMSRVCQLSNRVNGLFMRALLHLGI